MAMATGEAAWTQLATRIPKGLHCRLRLYCVTHDTSVMDIVTAIEERGSQAGNE